MKKLIFIISILYILSPVDLIPEWAAGRFGLIDDLIVIGALYWYFSYRPARPGARRPGVGAGGQEPDENEPLEKDPYLVLGVARDAAPEEIKHAYRELANKYHPDKVSHLGDEFREIANKRFKEIQRAYQLLTKK